MTENAGNDPLCGIDELLAGELNERRCRELLAIIVRDGAARRALEELLELQDQARAAYGFDRADDAMRRSMRSLSDSLHQPPTVAPVRRQTNSGRRPMRSIWRTSSLMRIAAVVVVAVSLYVAVTAYRASDVIRSELARSLRHPTMPQLSERQLASYRMVWNELLDPTQRSRPWVLLRDGGGAFGYVSVAEDALPHGKLVLLRCALFDPGGKRVSEVNLLLPSRRGLTLSVPEAARAGSQSLHCDVWVRDGRAGIALTAGNGAAGGAGVRGRTGIGDKPIEIGQFMLDGETLRVMLQAVPFNAAAG